MRWRLCLRSHQSCILCFDQELPSAMPLSNSVAANSDVLSLLAEAISVNPKIEEIAQVVCLQSI